MKKLPSMQGVQLKLYKYLIVTFILWTGLYYICRAHMIRYRALVNKMF